MTTEEIVWGYLIGKGTPEKVVAAIMGNIYAESGFDETLIEVGNGIGLGLCQWSFSRRDQLEAYGIDLTHQLNFLWSELTGQDLEITGADSQWINKTGYLIYDDFINGNGTIEDLTAAFCFCWERPDFELAHLDVRQEWANTYYTQFGGTIVEPPDEPPVTGNVKLKNKYLYNNDDSLFGVKFTSKNNQFVLVKIVGDMAIIKDGLRIIKVPKNNLIYL